MTRKAPHSTSPSAGPAWDRALDWLLRVQAAPEDHQLQRQRDAWLAQDAGHAQAYRRAEHIWRLTGAVPARGQPVRPARWARRGWSFAVLALAACFALWLAPNIALLLEADYRTGAGETRDLTLPDGSIVSLDADSAIAAPAARTVDLLEGRAFFQVRRDAAHPFTVTAGEAKITVLGTAFDVLLSDRAVTVAVQSGSVRISASAAPAVVLRSGQQAIIERADGAVSITEVGAAGIAAWRSGRLVVESVAVADVIEALARHHRGIILLRDPALGARRITGVFDLRDPETALRAVLKPYGGRILRITPYLLLVEGS